MRDVLRQIEEAFADAPRPRDGDLLHEQCSDDGDIEGLYPHAHWRDVPEEVVEREYAALSFLSPEGFRHFVPAYMSFALRHLDTGAAAVDSTIWSFAPGMYEGAGLRAFARSKLERLDARQQAAVVAFLLAVRDLGDEHDAEEVEKALIYWPVEP